MYNIEKKITQVRVKLLEKQFLDLVKQGCFTIPCRNCRLLVPVCEYHENVPSHFFCNREAILKMLNAEFPDYNNSKRGTRLFKKEEKIKKKLQKVPLEQKKLYKTENNFEKY